mmetsp:Transcript_22299/g.47010  ORF Transcript_22299/g.47010 Transcript_22299/m.47010 type:complete len:102 (+) Transcript_22299:217-522(+)
MYFIIQTNKRKIGSCKYWYQVPSTSSKKNFVKMMLIQSSKIDCSSHLLRGGQSTVALTMAVPSESTPKHTTTRHNTIMQAPEKIHLEGKKRHTITITADRS